jgi:hypothetical protein
MSALPTARFVLADAAGAIVGRGMCATPDLAVQSPPPGGSLVEVTEEQAAAVAQRPGDWRVEDGALVPAGS